MATYFKEEWLSDPLFEKWLVIGKDKKSAKCKICQVQLNLSNMGRRAVISHMDGKKHVQKSKPVSCYFKPAQSTSKKQAVLIVDQCDKTCAEIYSVLHAVKNNFSLSSCNENGLLYQKMFSDSNTAKSYEMGRTKLSYDINFGLGPYFHRLLTENIKKSPYYTLSFDESLNDFFQNCQLDLNIRFWNSDLNHVESRYFDSKFLGHPTAKNLLESMTTSLATINTINLTQLCMDSPSVNWLLLNLLEKQREQQELPKLLNIGSCNLHVIHGAFKSGFQSAEWNIGKLMKASYNLFHNSPARRADYVTVTESENFPYAFCSTRWVEDQKVAERLCLVWENIKKMTKYWESLPKSKQPKCKSYETVLEGTKDELTLTKLNFFGYIASLLQKILLTYQTDAPMIPFLFEDLFSTAKSLMGLIIKQDVLNRIINARQLQKFDFTKKGKFSAIKMDDNWICCRT